MKVLFAASEAMPIIKTGGLADVVGALPKALSRKGVEVTVVLPKYGEIPEDILARAVKIAETEVQLGWRTQYCGIEEFWQDGIRYVLIDNEFYFKRGYLYGYGDEAERFAFFSFAVLEALDKLEEMPDIIHCHDWQTGLIPFLLRTKYKHRAGYTHIRTVFTIHNLQYQGVFSREVLQDLLATGDNSFTQDSLDFYGAGSCMKAGLLFADKLTTVSPTYAQEIQTEAFGEKLDGVIRQRSGDLRGILNGIDTDVYDPMKDPHLAAAYRNSLTKKRLNKIALQEELGLPLNGSVPMIGIVSRLTGQKGFDILAEALYSLMQENLQLVVLGAGDQAIEAMLHDTCMNNREKMAIWFGFNESLARRIYAASDIYLMPSRFEPCGLSQMIALRYRTVPVVRETGGLRDTVDSYNEYTGTGNGFSFVPATAHDLLFTVRRALSFYENDEAWRKIIANGAKKDYGWESSARQYQQLYREIVS
ncbi:glycogen synthase [Cohnella kolymensis]|uniref:Glycogen synthase n=1 Tax=Cohnella kolymensis TaxID=1590652 RepID=A0ABR4ZZV4_9BACL|nr:glycogen synthase GlgA [Cohnella kolymensis]KIL34348.1 glycogen synthase [Cohnella kolymensis]